MYFSSEKSQLRECVCLFYLEAQHCCRPNLFYTLDLKSDLLTAGRADLLALIDEGLFKFHLTSGACPHPQAKGYLVVFSIEISRDG